METRYDLADLRRFAKEILTAAGLPEGRAEVVALGLVLGDVYGQSTHGLALLADYVSEIDAGAMATSGEPEILSDTGVVACWDARRLPGIWVTARAVEIAVGRAETHGIGAVAIRRSHHIACLSAFLEEPARRGFLVQVLTSDPSDTHVAPFGGIRPVMTPNPIAAGIPRTPDPILVDVSTSITTAGMCGRMGSEGRRFPGAWMLDARGTPTDDPTVLGKGGSIQPIGGLDHGHKGYGLSLLVEALTQGLSGYGRVEKPTEWGAAVFVLAIAPAAFAGSDAFMREVDGLADTCLASPSLPGRPPVRLPGQAEIARRRLAERDGLSLHAGIGDALATLAERYGMRPPKTIATPEPNA